MGFWDRFKKKDTDAPAKNPTKTKSKEPKVITGAEESYIRTKTVYNSKHNFIVLINLTEDYFFSMIEFMSAVVKASMIGMTGPMVTSIANTFMDEAPEPDGEEREEFSSFTETVKHNLYYVLLSGDPEQFAHIYKVIDDYSNPILQAIQDDIYEHCSSAYFKNLIEDGILTEGKFKYVNIIGDYSDLIYRDAPYRECYSDNAEIMLSNIPEVFTGEDLLPFVKYYRKDKMDILYITAETLLKHHDGLDYKLFETSDEMYKRLLGENYIDDIDKYSLPAYLRADDEEPVTGVMPVSQLSEEFQQQYDKFTGVADSLTEYLDIDEVVEDEEEERPKP